MPDREARRPMPAEQAILWKPLHDPHYVVASLQPADGGRRKIFIRQQALSRAETLVRAHGRRACGILLGHRYQCPVTGSEFLVIESVAERDPVSDETDIARTIAEALAGLTSRHRSLHIGLPQRQPEVVGWYRGVPTVDPKPSPATAAVHDSLFRQPWQTTLVIAESPRSPGGAFFLHDAVNRCWFAAPFYELPDHSTKPPQPKPTVVSWPQYMTAESVALTATPVAELSDVAPAKPAGRSEATHHAVAGNGDRRGPLDAVDVPPLASAPEARATTPAPTPPVTATADSTGQRVVDAASQVPATVTDRPVLVPVHHESGEVQWQTREGAPRRRADRPLEKMSTIDDRDQRMEVPAFDRPLSDDDDTTQRDDPGRFIALARTEGFFIAARYDTRVDSRRAETLWILNEPYSGMLLTVVTDSAVIDATLHYNLQTDDAGLQRVPFPEHRDPESKTVYVRETCVEGLRARCRRLRATNALLREWRVTPMLSLLTPAEWESAVALDTASARAADPIRELNNARIERLPEGVRAQFHLRQQ
ncbi:MAG TPA: hypothetical protein VFZ21_01055 [Gemmatimonadaceae bacterium]|jgi:hypothetical protein|nr:hypothetical protein [Gemmatimonadaceae bacterium]